MDETDDGDFLGTIAVVVLGDFFDEEDDINEDTRLDLDFPDIIDTDLVNDPDAIDPEVLGLATDGSFDSKASKLGTSRNDLARLN